MSEFEKALQKHRDDTNLKRDCEICFEKGWQACRERFLRALKQEAGIPQYPDDKVLTLAEIEQIAAELDAEKKP